MKSILIVNAQVVNEGQISAADMLIKNGRIVRIGEDLGGQSV